MRQCISCQTPLDNDRWSCPACHHEPEQRNGFLSFAPNLAAANGSDAIYAHEAILAAETRHFWFLNRSRLVVWALRRYFPEARRFLEVGCGTGFVLSGIRQELPRLELLASDSLVSSLRHAAARLPGVFLFQMDARRIPFRDEFDVIGAFDVIEHIDDDVEALVAMRDALKARGGLLLTLPQHPFLWSAVDEWSHHRRRYTRSEILSKLRKAGFEVMRLTSFSCLILPLLFVTRRRRAPAAFDPLAELRIGEITNASLAAACSAERALIRAGVSFPAGGSLLAVARRP